MCLAHIKLLLYFLTIYISDIYIIIWVWWIWWLWYWSVWLIYYLLLRWLWWLMGVIFISWRYILFVFIIISLSLSTYISFSFSFSFFIYILFCLWIIEFVLFPNIPIWWSRPFMPFTLISNWALPSSIIISFLNLHNMWYTYF